MPDTDSTTTTGVDNVTLSVAEAPTIVEGERYWLAPDSRDGLGGGVYFNNTEPLLVTVLRSNDDADLGPEVTGLTSRGSTSTQYVGRRYLTPYVEVREPLPRYEIGQEVTVDHDATVQGSGRVFFRWNADGTPVRGTIESDGGRDVVQVRGMGQHGETTQNVDRVFVRPTAPPSRGRDDIALGDVYRITSENGGHGFTVGTLVKVATGDGTPFQRGHRITSVYATTGDLLDQPIWCSGQTSFVIVESTTDQSPVNAVFEHAAVPTSGQVLGDALVANAEQQVADASPPQDLPPPEEVLRRIEADDDIDPEVERMDAAARITTLLTQVTTARTRVDDARQERAQWLDRLIERSHVVADDNEWCEVFDSGMEQLGLPTRGDTEPDTEEVDVTATIEVTVNFDEDQFASWFNENVTTDHNGVDCDSIDFIVNLTASREFNVSEGDCACDDDESDWEDCLPTWVAAGGYSWRITGTECTND